jgi:hypothetical protein
MRLEKKRCKELLELEPNWNDLARSILDKNLAELFLD